MFWISFYLTGNVLLFVLGLVLSVSASEGGVRRFGHYVLMVWFPLNVFLLSSLLIPDSKAASGGGWLPVFHVGKNALWPLILWAVAAYCRYLDSGRQTDQPRWVLLGLMHGTLVAAVCSLFGLLVQDSIRQSTEGWVYFLGVPIYVALGYGWAFRRCFLKIETSIGFLSLHAFTELPFWWWGVCWSQKIYENLPEHSSDCFVVTAASRGHPGWVGPFSEYGDEKRRMNRQLYRFRSFEACWRKQAPRSHRLFRGVYNRLGPRLACRIQTPWMADIVYLTLKPFEWLAGFCLWVSALKT